MIAFWVLGIAGVALAIVGPTIGTTEEEDENRIQFEAAFQGKCGHGSPCEQLCYELHDGMYECDCKESFVLREDGYSCAEINSTVSPPFFEELKPRTETDVIYQKDAEFEIFEIEDANVTTTNINNTNKDPSLENTNYSSDNENSVYNSAVTTQGPRLDQKLTEPGGLTKSKPTLPISPSSTTTEKPCTLNCGLSGGCYLNEEGDEMCLCNFGKGGDQCSEDVEIRSPRFVGRSWVAFSALRGAYKHVQLTLELRPEAYDGIFFLTGERDDMQGDFMAILLHQGFVEFRFDCGSGIGVVRSQETVILNEWNHITLYRHRWDAWLQLNKGRQSRGRSQGLFSRITFREPLFLGGTGNTTGLSDKLPVQIGFKGCLRHLEINDHVYKFAGEPEGEAVKGFGIEECTADRCSRVPCQHGGKCLTTESMGAVCLCPLGFSGDLCETRVDLQVPAFNGSSHLRFPGLGDQALSWLDVDVVFKPTALDGLILYNAQRIDAKADFMALYLKDGRLEFAFDLGSGPVVVWGPKKVTLGEWHKVHVSRTGRQAILTVNSEKPVQVEAPGAFTQLSLTQNLYLGGVPQWGLVSPRVRVRSSFVGCIQKIVINGRPVSILAEALAGTNVDNCAHPCVAKPCGEDGICIPQMDYFTCQCRPGYRDQICSKGPTPSFLGENSYLHFEDAHTIASLRADPLTLNVRFRTDTSNGLLVWGKADQQSEALSVGLENGDLVLRFQSAKTQVVVIHNTSTVHDNLWHRLKAVRDGSTGVLIVDNSPAITSQLIEIPTPHKHNLDLQGLYIGGLPPEFLEMVPHYTQGVQGCVADLILNTEYHLLLTASNIAHNTADCIDL